MSEVLKVRNLAKSFGRKPVFEDLSLTLEKGKVYGLLGRNGEGKTTLIRIIMGVIPADRGEMFYDGEIIGFGDAAYKRKIGYIPEDPFFFGEMKIQELLDFNSAFYPRWDSRKADDYLRMLTLDRRARVKTLSRGMKLKLGFLVSLAARPELLILDDPTSGIDVPTRHDFLRDIIRELADAGTTILFSTHMVHELERIVEHLIILHGGRLILDQDYEALRSMIKRIRFSFEGSAPEKIDLAGVLAEARDENRAELVIFPWDEAIKKKIEEISPSHLDVESLNLEEIFRSFVS
jgi:ABC-2 type transport system ATP-binding protein